jgi:predicted transposase YdaD
MTTNIVETLPWIDYGEVFTKLEERGKTEGKIEGKIEGKAEGRAERDMEIALKIYARQKQGANMSVLTQTLKELGISDEVIAAARKQHEAGRAQQTKKRAEFER